MSDRVVILRQAITKIVPMLASKEVTVTQRGAEAYVRANPVTGEPIAVNLPYLPDNAPDVLVDAIQGFLDHEVAHILFSDFGEKAKCGADKRLHNLTNILEDARVEKLMAAQFRGSALNLRNMGQFFLDAYTRPHLEKAMATGALGDAAGAALVPLLRAMSGQAVYEEFLRPYESIVTPIRSKLTGLESRVENLKSSADCREVAEEILRRLHDEGEGEDAPDKSESGAPKPSSGSGADKKDKGKGSKSKKDEGRPEEEPEPNPEDTPPDDEDREDEEAEDGASPDDEPELGEGGEGEGESRPDGSEGEPEGVLGEDEVETGSGSEPEGVDESEETVTGGPGEESEGGKSERLHSAVIDGIDRELANSVDENFRRSVESCVAEASRSAKYIVYTTDHDEVAPLPIGTDYRPEMFSSMADKVDHMVGPLQKDLERAIAARSLAVWSQGHRSGRLHSANLSRLMVGDDRVFRRKEEARTKDVAVSLVVDASGSMYGSKIHLAAQAVYALSQVLERMHITHEVIAFTTRGEADRMKRRETEVRLGIDYSRTENLYMPILKDYKERLNAEVKKRFGWLPHSQILANNVDGECVDIAVRRLLGQREKGKIMIVLSDGAPGASGNHSAQSQHLRRAVKDATDRGVKMVGLGIQSTEVTRYYPKAIVINEVGELPVRVVKELRSLILQ